MAPAKEATLSRDHATSGETRRTAVLSYNIHRCRGRDGVLDPRRVFRVILATGARIVGLQEVDLHSTTPDILQLAAESGYTVIPGPTFVREGGEYGNALLVRVPVVRVRRHDLSVARREPRGAIDADLDVGGGTLRVVVTHFGLRRAERQLQVKKLLSVLEREGTERTVPPRTVLPRTVLPRTVLPRTVLLGDFNEWWPGARTLRLLERWFGRQSSYPRTFPAGRPLLALDRIWVRPPEPSAIARAYQLGEARVASDHLPLMIEIPTGASTGASASVDADEP